MFQWSKKEVKSITFNPGVADESLLALIESHLEKNPNQSFSDLCKDALWQALCVPESVRPAPKPTASSTPLPINNPVNNPNTVTNGAGEPRIADLHRQVADLEERFYARESNRLDLLERQLMQVSQQVAQLAIAITTGVSVQVTPNQSLPASTVNVSNTPISYAPSQEVDPVISRLSQLVDDF
ncbi:plasmid segregation centromere-binding protein ParR [Brunnivagina elsteri]|uniref:Plasmid segregation centromere-binding protein ParR n=1 Tax=Brunnivagina elsteri CCALA 953 TaxID=987040 RepID=A0A2A2TAV0_9CYAN|nr:plasmid segregation centromere-binding protein ParR [Calothrix elsteri]PAX48247.1 plasmid segregation centromere-binding protein ParR [Calothrix elsteri CCALA 953]